MIAREADSMDTALSIALIVLGAALTFLVVLQGRNAGLQITRCFVDLSDQAWTRKDHVPSNNYPWGIVFDFGVGCELADFWCCQTGRWFVVVVVSHVTAHTHTNCHRSSEFFLVPDVVPCGITAAVSRPTAGGTFIEGIVGVPTTLNPLVSDTSKDQAAADVHALVFDGLVRIGLDGSPEPGLAESWDIDTTGTVYTFTLRSDVKWHDGESFGVDDVLFTLRSVQGSAYTGSASSGHSMADGVGRACRRAEYSLSVAGTICTVFEICHVADIASPHVSDDCS
jgi:hypothetical protein